MPTSQPSTDWTIARVLAASTEHLGRHGIDSARLDAELLLAHSLGVRRLDLFLQFDKPLGEPERDAYKVLLRRRAQREPVAYITRAREFYGLELEVTPAVLVPRPETELLVDLALELGAGPRPVRRFVDLGIGSGCITVALLKAWPDARAVGIDLSPAALALARRNAERHGVADRLQLLQADLSEALADQAFDAVLSNPPYVAEDELDQLAPEVRLHEPYLALVSPAGGLDHSRRLATWLARALPPHGFALVEVAAQRGPETQACFTQALAPIFQVSLHRDLAGLFRAVSIAPRHFV